MWSSCARFGSMAVSFSWISRVNSLQAGCSVKWSHFWKRQSCDVNITLPVVGYRTQNAFVLRTVASVHCLKKSSLLQLLFSRVEWLCKYYLCVCTPTSCHSHISSSFLPSTLCFFLLPCLQEDPRSVCILGLTASLSKMYIGCWIFC